MAELREHHRLGRQSPQDTPIAVGDVVLLHDDSNPRGFWKLARVQELLTGRDQKVRSAVVSVPAKGGRTKTLNRPVQKLYPLETTPNQEQTHEKEDESQGSNQVSQTRPRRRAAGDARDRIKAIQVAEGETDSD